MYTSFTDWESGMYLEHHGTRGMKWGVRNYQNPDGTLTAAGRARYGKGEGGSRRMARQYNRQMRKLNKLKARADIETQRANAEKYDKRAKAGMKVAGIGAAIAGAGAAAEYGGANLRNRLVSQGLKASRASEWNAHDINSKQYTDDWSFWENQRRNLTGNELGDWHKIYDANQKQAKDLYNKNKMSIAIAGLAERAGIKDKARLASQIHRAAIAAGAGTAAVGVGVAAVSKLQARAARTRMTEAGHSKAVARVKAQTEKMQKMFADTPYSQLVNNQNKPKKRK